VVDNDKNPVEQAIELLVYAPLGLALDARELMPKFIERGRNQVTVARMIGKFAVSQGQAVAGKHLSTVEQQVQATLESFGLVPSGSNGPATAAPSAPAEGAPNLVAVPDVVEPTPAADLTPHALAPDEDPIDVTAAPEPAASSLAIPDYDSLAASQVIPRLAGLSADELDAVRQYESLKRGRKTILSRITQLQSA
jgi:hypothetical protein